VELVTAFGDATVGDVAATRLLVESANGKIAASAITATEAVRVRSDFGGVELRSFSAGSAVASSANGEVVVEDGALEGLLEARSSFGDVSVAGVNARGFTLESDNGDVTLDGASGSLDVGSAFGDIRVTGGVRARLALRSDNGSIRYEGSLDPSASHLVESGFGDTVLVLPEDSAFDVQLETGFGTVHSDLAVTTQGELKDSAWRGTVGGGGPLLRVDSANGDITINTLAGAAGRPTPRR
jgi:DUF4097 and DUF4098 domain-containing protein YvlB